VKRDHRYWLGDKWEEDEEDERGRVEKIIEEVFSNDLMPKPTSTYVVYLPPLAKALVEEVNRKYMFYEFICNYTRALTRRVSPRDRKRVHARVPTWFYEMAKLQGFNSVGIYLLSSAWMDFFNLEPNPKVPSTSVQVYGFLYRSFGDPVFPDWYRPKIETITSRWWLRPHKVFDMNHRLARRLRYVKERYKLTRTNTMLLYLAFFLRYVKDRMVRE